MSEFKHFTIESKFTESEDYAIASGYASVFGNVDLANDIVERGAFAESLKKSATVILLADHEAKTDSVIGYAMCSEDERGLKSDLYMNLKTESGREAYEVAKMMQKAGIPLGLSIGYMTKDKFFDNKGIRHIKQADLLEISFTPFPANTKARITGVKSQEEIAHETAINTTIHQLKSDLKKWMKS